MTIRRYEVILIGIIILSIFIPMIFAGKEIRFDIYLFHDYAANSNKGYEGRKLSVILYEIGSYLRCVVPLLILYLRTFNKVFFVILFVCALEFIFYLLFFGQGTDPYLIGLTSLLTLYLFFEKKIWKKRKEQSGFYGPGL